jgi:hypothetical protein
MVSVAIAGESRNLDDAPESWINQQVARRRKNGVSVCVVVTINTSGVTLIRSGGHLPKGEYDVDHVGKAAEAVSTKLHG